MAVAVDMRWLLLLFLAGEDSASVRRLLDTDDLADHADNTADDNRTYFLYRSCLCVGKGVVKFELQ